MSSHRVVVGSARLFTSSGIYDWDTDFPIPLQDKLPDGTSNIILEFRLTDAELSEFRTQIGSKLKDTLPLRICFGPSEATVTVHKKGPGGAALSKKSEKIAQFVARRVEFEHIPAVRTAGSAQEIVSALLERELRKLEDKPEYVEALKKVAALQQPALDQLSKSIKQTLTKFLPKVSHVSVEIADMSRLRAMRRNVDVIVNDGTPTPLQYKGDGVQSLAALALMRHASETAATGKNLLIAIEEPESHLHSSAIHEIKDVLNELSKRHQVVVTTHNALFVDRVRSGTNILVSKGKARPARTVEEIRQILGVRASDNLRHAELMLIAEGDDDCLALRALLAHASQKLKTALQDHTLALDSLNGANNLPYKLGLARAAICATHCVLDHDAAGQSAFERASGDGLTNLAETTFITCPGRNESELEDLYDSQLYAELLLNRFGVALSPEFKGKKKWSDRMREVFQRQGKPWSDKIEQELKRTIADKVATNPGAALLPACRGPIDALIEALERRLELRNKPTAA